MKEAIRLAACLSLFLLAVASTGCLTSSLPSVELSVLSLEEAYQARSIGSYSGNISEPPGDGQWFVVVSATVISNLDSTLFLDPNYFKLEAGGQNYPYSLKAEDAVPSYIPPQSSSNITLVYEIPIGSVPTALRFDNALYTASVPLQWSGETQFGGQIGMRALSVEDASTAKANGHYSGDLPAFPDPNLQYLVIRLNITNNLDSTLLMSSSYFSLRTSDNTSWDVSPELSSSVPGSLAPGNSAIVTLGYGMSQGINPISVAFDNFTEKVVVSLA